MKERERKKEDLTDIQKEGKLSKQREERKKRKTNKQERERERE